MRPTEQQERRALEALELEEARCDELGCICDWDAVVEYGRDGEPQTILVYHDEGCFAQQVASAVGRDR